MQNYSLIEKLAIVKSLDEIIAADNKFDPAEEKILKEIMKQMDFKPDFVNEARKMRNSESIEILKRMPLERKKLFADLMYKIAIADGYIDANETNIVIDIYQQANIDIESPNDPDPEPGPDLSMVYFESRGYFDYPEGPGGKREYYDEPRHLKMEPVINTPDQYSLTIYNAEKSNTLWGKEIALKPVQLILESNQTGQIKFNSQAFGRTELSFFHSGPEIDKIMVSFEQPFKVVEYLAIG